MQEFSFEVAYETGNTQEIKHSFGNTNKQYPLASITKSFTGYLTIILASKNKLRLEDEILENTFSNEKITVKELLGHSSGLEFDSFSFKAPKNTYRNYSNIAYEILSEYISDITDKEFEETLTQEIIEPLGLENFELKDEKKSSKDGHASLQDLRKFAKELLKPTLVTKDLLAQATKQFLYLPGIYLNTMQEIPNHAFGLGFEIKADKPEHWMGEQSSPKTFGHFGSAGSFFLIEPEKQIYNIFLGEQPYNFEHRKKWPQLNDELLKLHNF